MLDYCKRGFLEPSDLQELLQSSGVQVPSEWIEDLCDTITKCVAGVRACV